MENVHNLSSVETLMSNGTNNLAEALLSNGTNHLQVQDIYILPQNELPQLSEVCYSESIQAVDLQDLDGPNRTRVVQEIRFACENDGFFQIVNHGVPERVMKSMMGIAKEFFEMPVEDRACLYSEDTNQQVRLSTNFNVRKEKFYNWRDYLIHPCHPPEEVMGSWPEKPAAYRPFRCRRHHCINARRCEWPASTQKWKVGCCRTDTKRFRCQYGRSVGGPEQWEIQECGTLSSNECVHYTYINSSVLWPFRRCLHCSCNVPG